MVSEMLIENGFSIVNDVYSIDEVNHIIGVIDSANSNNEAFRKTKDIFAIRKVLKEIPEIQPLIFNENLVRIMQSVGGEDCFVVKSIYFDKPEMSNWFVAYHQDLTISVDEKFEVEGFSNWTKKQNQFSVQPPNYILENIFTVRIHLDDTTAENGAVKVLEKSHLYGICRTESINWSNEKEVVCEVNKGGVMLMKPLLFHASTRTTNQMRRRVLHIEFSNLMLNNNLEWSELLKI